MIYSDFQLSTCKRVVVLGSTADGARKLPRLF